MRGRVVPEIDAPDIRELFIGSYRLIYQVTADRVFILVLVHGTRDLTALCERRGVTGRGDRSHHGPEPGVTGTGVVSGYPRPRRGAWGVRAAGRG